jgi:hypothetical protein
MSAEEGKARNLLQQDPGRVCHRETPDDTRTLSQTRAPRHHHETANGYTRVVAWLPPDFRVIVCRDEIQWILQRKDARRSGQFRWRAVGYFVTRRALVRSSRIKLGENHPSPMEALDRLPEQFERNALLQFKGQVD